MSIQLVRHIQADRERYPYAILGLGEEEKSAHLQKKQARILFLPVYVEIAVESSPFDPRRRAEYDPEENDACGPSTVRARG